MTGFDAAIILIVAASIALAAYRGGLAELATLLALAIGAGVGFLAAAPAAGAIGQGGSTIATLAAGAGIGGFVFLSALVGGSIFLSRLRLKPRQRLIDRIGGGAFGFVRAFAFIGLAFLGYAYYQDAENRPDMVRNAALLPFAEAAAGMIKSFAPAREPLNVEREKIGEGNDGGVAPAQAAAETDDDVVAAILTGDDSQAGALGDDQE